LPASDSFGLKFTCKELNWLEMWVELPPSWIGFNTPEMTGRRRAVEAEEECHKMPGLLWLSEGRRAVGR